MNLEAMAIILFFSHYIPSLIVIQPGVKLPLKRCCCCWSQRAAVGADWDAGYGGFSPWYSGKEWPFQNSCHVGVATTDSPEMDDCSAIIIFTFASTVLVGIRFPPHLEQSFMIRHGVIYLDSLDDHLFYIGVVNILIVGLGIGGVVTIHRFIDVLLGCFDAIIVVVLDMQVSAIVIISEIITITNIVVDIAININNSLVLAEAVVVVAQLQRGVCVTQSVKRRVLFKGISITPHTVIIQSQNAGRVGGIKITDTMTAAHFLLVLLVGF